MQRRTVLQLFTGVAVAGVRSFALQSPARRDRIVIAGGGIIGVNIAYQLAKRGAAVTVLERVRPAAGATANSFAWLNAKKQPLSYFTLNRPGIEGWRQLNHELNGELPVIWGGSLDGSRLSGVRNRKDREDRKGSPYPCGLGGLSGLVAAQPRRLR